MSEKSIQTEIMLAGSNATSRLHRNNVGQAWLGRSHVVTKPVTMRLVPGDVVVHAAQAVRYGLAVGSSDLIGLTAYRATPQDVGRTIAVFTAIEVKDQARATDAQLAYIAMVRGLGGIAGIAKSVQDYKTLIEDFSRPK